MAPLLIAGAMELAKIFLPSMVRKIAGDASGKVAGKVIDIASKMTGVPITDGDSLINATAVINQNPELAAQFQTRMAELDLEETQLLLADVQDARSRDVELTKAGKTNVRADVMVVAAFAALIVVSVFMITADEIDTGVLAFLTTIGGMLMKNISTAFDFEFGSSRGSKSKTSDMGSLMKMLGNK